MDKQKVYLAGPIEKEKDGGKGIRNSVKIALKNFDVQLIDPCEFSFNTEFKNIAEIKQANPNSWKGIVHHMLRSDLAAVENADAIVAIFNDNASVGTFSEMVFAAYSNIPIITYFEDGNTQYEDLHPWLQVATTIPVSSITELKQAISAICGGNRNGEGKKS